MSKKNSMILSGVERFKVGQTIDKCLDCPPKYKSLKHYYVIDMDDDFNQIVKCNTFEEARVICKKLNNIIREVKNNNHEYDSLNKYIEILENIIFILKKEYQNE